MQISDTGGGVVVTYGGTPHRLPLERAGAPWRSPATLASPAMIVASGLHIVPFIDYAGVLADLIHWCDVDHPAGLRVVSGPGGAGKTRTALRLCQEMENRSWLAGVLAPDADIEGLRELARVPTDLLVVVEDAGIRGNQLATLVPLLTPRARSGRRTRMLLTHRDHPVGSGHLEVLSGANEQLGAWLSQAPVIELARCPPDVAARGALYSGAAHAFGGYLSLPSPPVGAPAELAGGVFSNPQMIVIGAYLGVNGARLDDSAAALFERFIGEHEDRYWNWMAGRQNPPLRPDQALRRQVAALVALAGADDEGDATRLLALIDESALPARESPVSLARWASALYPGPRYWNGLRPDMLGEYLVASTYCDDQVLLAGVLGGGVGDRRPESLTVPVGLLARAAVGHRGLADSVSAALTPNIGYLCDQVAALATTDSSLAVVVTDLVQVCPPDPAGLPAVLDNMPAGPRYALRPMASVLTQQTAGYFRELAERDPDAHLPNLAVALNNLSVRLADLGRRSDAAAASTEAVGYYRSLAHRDPAAYQPHLATSLYNLSLRLAELGRGDQAAAAMSESVGYYRNLARVDAAAHQPDLAISLYLLSLRLAELGRHDQAAAAITDAVAQYRELTALDPAYRPKLAASLGDLSLRLADLDRRDQAGAAISEAVGQYRELTGINPGRYRPKLAAALSDLSLRLAAMGRFEQARAAMIESVEHYRRLAASDASHRPALAAALENLALRLTDVGARREAAARHEEAQAALRQIRGGTQSRSRATTTA